ncbi:hypothetical protein MK852_13915 [Shewanella benthica]|nr:hypothetical protein [Shewanella benthica]MBE7214761.1 hypothetical protein [Shewanella benthica]MCL1063205.1 hypothetical protein [Shewanella benthica]
MREGNWRDNDVPKDKIFSVNRDIAKGSEALWSSLEKKLSDAVDTGLLK